MKKIVLLFAFLSVLMAKAQEKVSFPESFTLESGLLNGMVFAKLPDEYVARGFTGNPAVSDNADVIGKLTDFDNDVVSQVYYQIFQDEKDESDDAGVIVSRFVSEEALKNNLEKLRDQSNLAYLIKDNYLILVWSDVSQNSRGQITRMVSYYQNKLQAEFFQARPLDCESSIAVETEEPVQEAIKIEPIKSE